jgi:non-specific protein-tyrosine kinase
VTAQIQSGLVAPLPDLITLTQPRSPAAEAYRTLRTNLIFSSIDQPLSTLLVTSAAPEEGKSTTLANLAVTTAQGGRRTILVDCDLRRPTQQQLWGLPKGARGLTSMVLEADGLANPPLASVGVENLWVLPSGPLPPNPADLLGSRRMEEIIGVLKARADLVLFDAPPVLAVTDAALLASKLDGALLVVAAGATRREHAQRAKEMLEKVHIRIVGAALTNAPLDSSMRAYYSAT